MSDQKPQPQELDFDFHLTAPFEYALKGQTQTASFIRLTAPTSRNRRECSFLKQAFFRALSTVADKPTGGGGGVAPEAARGEIQGEDVMDLICMSRDVELEDVLEASRRLFSSGVATVDGEEKLTGALLDGMSMDDLEAMTGRYLAFFPLRSSLRRLNEI